MWAFTDNDLIGDGGGGGGNIPYSFEEQAVPGLFWVDGKQVYQKSFYLPAVIFTARNFDHNIPAFDQLVDWHGSTRHKTAHFPQYPLAYTGSSSTNVFHVTLQVPSATQFRVHAIGSSGLDAHEGWIHVRYTCTDR